MESLNRKAEIDSPTGARPVKIGACILGYVKGRKRYLRRWAFAPQRFSEIEAVLRSRHGSYVDTDDGEIYLPHLAAAASNARRSALEKDGKEALASDIITATVGACRRWLPHVDITDIEEAAFEAVETPRFEKADEIAVSLGISFKERTALSLRTIGAYDKPKRQRQKAVKSERIAKQKAKRRANGVKPREEYEDTSVSAIAKSWNVSRVTVYAWRKKGDPRGLYKSETNMGIPLSVSDLLSSGCKGATEGRALKAHPRDDFRSLAFGRLAQLLEKGAAS